MSCIDANLAVEFFDGTLSDAAAKHVESHAEGCSMCRILLAELARSPSVAQLSPTLPAGLSEHVPLQRGDKVGRFVVLNRLGSGGMGVVFSAYDPKLDRKVALKLLRSSSSVTNPAEAQTRLMREAQAMAQLSHPNVISVYDVGTIEDEVYIAMELVEGGTLTSWLRKWDRTWSSVLDKFVQAARALAAAHAAGLVHRDFKPDNVLVGNDERVRVMDFGLARWSLAEADQGPTDEEARLAAVVSELNRTLTRSGTIMGTPRYMAPEQFLGRETDARSDQFSFCVALYEALYDEYPFEGGCAQQLAEKQQDVELPRPSKNVPLWLHKILERGLKRTAQQRFPSMDVLLQSAVPIQSVPPRRRWIALAGVLAAAVVLLSLYLWETQSQVQSAQRDRDHAIHTMTESAAKVRRLEVRLSLLTKKEVELRGALKNSRFSRRELAKELRNTVDQITELKVSLTNVTDEPRPTRKRVARVKTVKSRAPRALSQDQVFRALDNRMSPVNECFREWRERHRDDEVTLSLRFTVDTVGGVIALLTTGTEDKVLRECVNGFIRDVRFPVAPVATAVTYDLRTRGSKLIPKLIVAGVNRVTKAQ